jgi:peptidoglycan/LPS O-acetylase OafA/YrhL
VAAAATMRTVSILGLFQGESVKSRLDLSRGRTTGFDYLRIALALLVLLVHVPRTTTADDAWLWSPYVRPLTGAILPAFFALSGFLVTGSLQRSKTLVEFAVLRALRLVPALAVEVMVAALILGPLLTVFPLDRYFTDVKFYRYALNIVGDIQYKLPGLFLHNPDPDMVNRQLWTIPAELRCYAALMVLAVLGFARRWPWMLALLGACVIGFPLFDFIRHRDIFAIANVPPMLLVLAFLAGVSFNLLAEWTPLNGGLFILCIGLGYVAMLFRETTYFAAVPLTYVTLFMGLSRPPKTFITAAGDYSYGVYLYGFPIQQAYACLFPHFRVWWASLVFTLPIVLGLAFLSWTLVESRVLGRRGQVIALAGSLQVRARQALARRWPNRPPAGERRTGGGSSP